ncbi:MAG: hypothetical protein WCT18_04835 [Patescibacteria group bacterium]
MCTAITHIVLGEKIFKKYFSDKDRKEFFVASTFPDIRYLGVLHRSETHFEKMTLPEAQKEDSFGAGWKFHSLIDLVREKYARENGYYSRLFINHAKILAGKLLEDEIFYNKIDNWPEIIGFYEKALDFEKSFKIEEKRIDEWHNILRTDFLSVPSTKTRAEVFRVLKFPPDFCFKTEKYLSSFRQNKKMVKKINEMYKNLENLLENFE